MLREKTAIKRLNELANGWPRGLWIYSADGRLYVMRCGKDGEQVMNGWGGVDQDYVVDTISIPSDGGDW